MTDAAETRLEKPVENVPALGGGSRSPLWCRVVADIMQRPVSVTREIESTCLGAAMLAAPAAGMHKSISEAAEAMSGTGDHFEPDDGRAAFYDRLYNEAYREIYPSLKPLFPALSDALKMEKTQNGADERCDQGMPVEGGRG